MLYKIRNPFYSTPDSYRADKAQQDSSAAEVAVHCSMSGRRQPEHVGIRGIYVYFPRMMVCALGWASALCTCARAVHPELTGQPHISNLLHGLLSVQLMLCRTCLCLRCQWPTSKATALHGMHACCLTELQPTAQIYQVANCHPGLRQCGV